MEFTCPHCGETFYAPTRRGSTSEKVKEAARRNGTLGGRTPKVSQVDAAKVYRKKANWTWQDFVVALKQATGVELSRARAFALLKNLKTQESANSVRFGDRGIEPAAEPVFTASEMVKVVKDDERPRQAVRGKKVTK